MSRNLRVQCLQRQVDEGTAAQGHLQSAQTDHRIWRTFGAEVADVVANAMKDWAIERGATHYTHWFQPLTGSTAESTTPSSPPTADGGVIMEFSASS
jgi:glutamine synthetase type III